MVTNPGHRPDANPGHRPNPGAAPTGWQTATITAIVDETPRAKTFRLRLDTPTPHLAGQHYIVRLTAPDGYQASRSYSVASAPAGSPEIEITVERLDDGEVSTFLHDVVEPGDEVEVRGPIGRWFVWDGSSPALLVGGGSGVVPLMAMLRHARRADRRDHVRLVVSARSPEDLYYAAELPGPETTIVYTRQVPPDVPRRPHRLDIDDLPVDFARTATVYVCGSTGFCNHATDLMIDAGIAADSIRVERFGPTGA